MNYIITKNISYFSNIGDYNYCDLSQMELPDVLAIDSETTGLFALHEEMFCLQIGTGKNNYIIDFYTTENAYKLTDVVPYIKNKPLIFHNALFDLGFCYKYGFYPDNIKDTMLASKVLYNGDVTNLQADFKSVMQRELNVLYDKTDQKNIHIVKLSQSSTIEYSFNDVDRLIELHEALEKKIIDKKSLPTYELHCNYIKVLAYMEQCGLPISTEKWKNKMIEDQKNSINYAKKIEEYIFDNLFKFRDKQLDMFDNTKRILISINSPIQMVKIFNSLGINTKDKDNKDSINEKVISKSKHEFVSLWLKYQEANHRVTTFGQKILDKVIGGNRIYTNFNPMVDTARISTRKGHINFLNFPSDKITRDCFVANEGNIMVVADYSAQEAVLLADKTKDEAMMASVLEGADLHSLLTKKIHPELAHLSDKEIATLHSEKRTQSKISRFALSFGGSAFTLHINQNIPMSQAILIENSFKELHKRMYEWGQENYNNAVLKGYIESADGWKLHLPEFNNFKSTKEQVENMSNQNWTAYKEGKEESRKYWEAKDKKEIYDIKNKISYEYYKKQKPIVSKFFKLKSEYGRLCLNNPIQSSAAHMTKWANVLLFDWIKNNNYLGRIKIVNCVHDEIILEVEENLKEIACQKLSEFMIQSGNKYLQDLTISADAAYGDSWYAAKKG